MRRVRRQVGREGIVEKRHVALARVALEHGEHADARAFARQQHAAAAGDVVELQAAGHAGHDAQLPRSRHGVERAIRAGLRGREPDLVARGRPGEAALARPLARQRRLLSGQVDDRDGSGVVERKRVVEERDPIALRREPRVADVTGGLVQDLAHRVLDARLSADVAHDHERGAVRGPVGLLHAVGDVARRAAGQRRARERARADARMVRPAVDRDRHFARRRDREQVRARQLERQRVGAGRMLQEELERAPVPGRAVDDRLPVRREARRADRAAAEGDLLVRGRQRLDEALLEEHARDERGQDREAREQRPQQRAFRARRRAARAPDTSPETETEASDRCSRMPRTSRARSRVEA